MNKKYIIFILSTILILLIAYKSSQNIVKDAAKSEKNQVLLMPELEKNIDNVGAVIIRSKGQSFKVQLENGNWVMPNKYNYPVSSTKIRQLVQNSAKIKILEAKTSQEANLATLGLDDPEKSESNAVRIALLSVDGKTTYADYIKGINRKGISGNSRDEVYARLFNSNQAYLVHGELNFDLGSNTLLGGENLAITYDKLQTISFDYPAISTDNFTISKAMPTDLDFAITEPAGRVIKNFGKVSSISTSLEYMDLQDIVKREEFQVKEPETIIKYKTFNGLTLEVNLFKQNDENWLTFTASADEKNQQASEDAAKITALTSPWVYKVDFKSTGGFYYKLADLIKE
jgi:hypothetical protein